MKKVSASSTSQDDYYDLGTYRRPITTRSAEAQIWFNRGLIWCFAFNHEEAAECFEKAIAEDQDCAMAYWGLAYALGPNYNQPWHAFDDEALSRVVARTHRAVVKAKEKAGAASPVERALVQALELRYPQDRPAKDCSIWSREYAEAMRSVYKEFSCDLDVATLFADALMNLTPWKLWDLSTGKPAVGARTLEVKDVLDRALAREGAREHPGLLHLYIHLMEMSPTPEAALTIADNLRGLVPDAGHLHHMPTHLDILLGDYRRAVASNSDAIRADEKYLARAGALNFYTLYRAHDYHFRVYAAMFSAQSKIALDTMTQLEASIPEELLLIQSPPMADYLEAFMGMRVEVLIRFGFWQEILALPLPSNQALYAVTTAMIHYAKAIAHSTHKNIPAAESQRDDFRSAVSRVPASRTLFNNKCSDILAIAASMLDGELDYHKGNYDSAFAHLRHSISLDDALPYDEPWGWMQPTRHAYGALLLEQGHIKDAAAVYRADLGLDNSLPRARQHPNNVWALHGYHECLVRLGREAEARILEPQLRLAIAVADVPIRGSCFCRLTQWKGVGCPDTGRL